MTEPRKRMYAVEVHALDVATKAARESAIKRVARFGVEETPLNEDNSDAQFVIQLGAHFSDVVGRLVDNLDPSSELDGLIATALMYRASIVLAKPDALEGIEKREEENSNGSD